MAVAHAVADAEVAVFEDIDDVRPSSSAVNVRLSSHQGAPGAPYNQELNEAAVQSSRMSLSQAAAAQLSNRLASCSSIVGSVHEEEGQEAAEGSAALS